MPRNFPPYRRTSGLVAAALGALILPQSTTAHENAGGATASGRPQIASVKCEAGAPADAACREGMLLALRGERLADVRRVVFLGRPGRRDDRHVHPRARSPHRVLLRVPARAATGPLRAISGAGGASRGGPRLRVESEAADAAPAPPASSGDGVFPVRGRYEFGTATNGFGGGRGHQGQDIFAECGTPVVAARAGVVQTAGTAGNEGNYAVIEAPDGSQQAYLHILQRPSVRKGDRIPAGQSVGKVGQSGNAVGCHLHFELWSAPGRFVGGDALDPRPDLDRWARSG